MEICSRNGSTISLSAAEKKREEENKRNRICGSSLVLVDP
jgi:hypothetical protein